MQPYVIRQGDYLAKLAHKFGFDADTVWNDDRNADLRQLRPNHNILYPTDILYIPDQVDKQPVWQRVVTGRTNIFVTDAPTAPMTIRFLDAPLASKAYTLVELPHLTALKTGADGTARFDLPVTMTRFTVTFTVSGKTFVFNAGHLDPPDTLTGVFTRLQNLGYIAA